MSIRGQGHSLTLVKGHSDFKVKMFDFWPVYSGERFRASWPSCLFQLNLASQSVLEGLNACLDHRAEVYVPELGKTFHIQHEKTRLFACQNPLNQGGGRKGLPRSFLNRFTQVSSLWFSKKTEVVKSDIIRTNRYHLDSRLL